MKRYITLLTIMACSIAQMMGQSNSQYIIHNSGNLLGAGSSNRAVLLDKSDKNAKPLRMAKQSDGSYIIALDGAKTLYLSLGTENGWSTYFLADSTDARAHYDVVQSGSYTRLKNKQTNGYLGTDDNNIGAYVYSDKNGEDSKHRWFLSDTPTHEVKVDTVSYPVCADADRQLVEGWGVSLCWWANMCGKWSDSKIDQLISWMVSPDGLNWNIFRYNIGGGDDPNWTNCNPHHMGGGKGLRAEMEGFQDERNGEFHWERDAAQRKIMLKIKEKRPDAIFEAFSNSCPWWMTESGCCSGNADGGKDNLKPEYYEDFARYLVEVCKHYKDVYGIEFKTLEPFNESVTNFWYKSGVQEGCHFDFSSQVAFVRVLAPILKESGLNTIISAADETNIGLAVNGLREFQNKGASNLVGQWNSHTYSGDNRARSQFGSLSRAEGKTVWMSETGSGGSGISGNLSMAQRLFDDVRYIAPEAWIDWQYMEENNDQWCFVKGSFANATFSKVKNYYVRQQITRYIKQGYTIVESLNEQSLAAVNPTRDTLVVALINTDGPCVHRISLPLVKVNGTIRMLRTSESESLKTVKDFSEIADNILEVKMPEASIATLIIPIEMKVKDEPAFCKEDTYMIIPQSNVKMAAAVVGSNVKLAAANPSSPNQQWTIEEIKEGVYTLRNGNGKYVTAAAGNIGLASRVSSGKSQNFNIVKVDGIHVRITNEGDATLRGWDLSNQSLSEGTVVCNYAYGNSASADHRNWYMIRISSTKAEASSIDIINNNNYAEGEEHIYSISGIKQNNMQHGINIIRQKDGTTRKVMIGR